MKNGIRKMTEDRMNRFFYLVPEHMHQAFKNYVLDKIEPGSFLRYVLENDLAGAALAADLVNRAALADIGAFCIEAIPLRCWGSKQRVEEWLQEGEEA